jgi:hypothetical protein
MEPASAASIAGTDTARESAASDHRALTGTKACQYWIAISEESPSHAMNWIE